MKSYPLFDRPTETDFYKFGHDAQWRNTDGGEGTFLRAIMSGECRQPNAGEWYLTGEPIEAYLAPHALQDSFHIAKLVLVQRIAIEQIVQT